MMTEMEVLLNFTADYYEVSEYGQLRGENHIWTGLIGEIVNERSLSFAFIKLLMILILYRADIALGALSVMAEREAFIDFTIPYYDLVGLSILMKRTSEETFLFKFMEVFEMEVWLLILLAYVVTSILMWIFDKLSPYSYQNNFEKYQVRCLLGSYIQYKSHNT